jgi:HEAT repeat protein
MIKARSRFIAQTIAKLPACWQCFYRPIAIEGTGHLKENLSFELVKKRMFIGLRALAALGLIAAVVIGLRAKPATYHGKTLKAWSLQLYSAPDQQDREAAGTMLKQLGPESVEPLIYLLERKDSLPRGQVFKWGANLPIRMRRMFFQNIRVPEESTVRAAAARSLGILGPLGQAAAGPLARALHDRDRSVCWEASNALGSLGSSSVSLLIPELKHSDPIIRQAAASALSKIGAPASNAAPALILALTDEDESVRAVAEQALGSMGVAAAPALADSIQNRSGNLRRAAAETAVRVVPSRRLLEPALIKMLQDSEPASRAQALRSLGDLQATDGNAIAAITNAFRDPDAEVRTSAAEAIGNFGKRAVSVRAALTNLSEDADTAVRTAAQEALAKISPTDPALAPN